MKKIFLIILSLAVMAGCSRRETAYDRRISESYVKGYHTFVADYDSLISRVRLEGIPIESGSIYFVEEGEYTLTYEYSPRFSLGMEVSYKKEDRGSDNTSKDDYRDRRVQEKVVVDGETRIQLEGKKVEFKMQGEVGS